ncbi:hypothetical protein [Streptosporangium sandarakinum]|uniref:hypothetical protein n=1 Tax=Streptosporangium sandarakinum TaxID=1260955 RepID=UPI0036816DCF
MIKHARMPRSLDEIMAVRMAQRPSASHPGSPLLVSLTMPDGRLVHDIPRDMLRWTARNVHRGAAVVDLVMRRAQYWWPPLVEIEQLDAAHPYGSIPYLIFGSHEYGLDQFGITTTEDEIRHGFFLPRGSRRPSIRVPHDPWPLWWWWNAGPAEDALTWCWAQQVARRLRSTQWKR